ncbi:MAG: P1 family peptidase [Balneolales bacterium]|nr:P1 family peptidase [Balneolales bacterium]
MKRSISILFLLSFCVGLMQADAQNRVRDLGIQPGILTPGTYNAITDVEGVLVGHQTILRGDSIRTGVTVVLPHDGNMFRNRVPAAVYVGNGYGKALGFTQVQELGELETPVALTNTLSVFEVAHGLADYMLQLPGNEQVRSVNPVVGETNDGWLNDIRSRGVSTEDVYAAIAAAASGSVAEGNVGAGTGTRALGYKAGIGTSSRVLPESRGGYTVGVLVQSNFGGILTVNGTPVGQNLKNHFMSDEVPYEYGVDGSIMIVVATDAPLTARNLERLAKRAFLGIAHVGGIVSNGSGDYVIAFSTSEDVRIDLDSDETLLTNREVQNNDMTPLFLAAIEATEEAILNSLFMSEEMSGVNGRVMPAIPADKILEMMGEE